MSSYFFKISLLISISLLMAPFAFATPDESFRIETESLKPSKFSTSQLFERLEAVFSYFKIAPEPDSQPFFQNLQGKQSLKNLAQVLPFLDPTKSFNRFYSLQNLNQTFAVNQDIDDKDVPDYEVTLSQSDLPRPTRKIGRFATRALPLAGVRIAIDPGHMGSDAWDAYTGKYIIDHQGHKLSEGVMTLQVALLLEQEFVKLGASVFVTRRDLVPVTPLKVKDLNLHAYGLEKMRASSLENWFRNLLVSTAPDSPPDSTLYRNFENSPNVKNLFSENMRGTYFIEEADLDARVQAINQFKPDIALLIHFDVAVQASDPHGLNTQHFDRNKAYVLGGFAFSELATREARRNLGRVLLNEATWTNSVKLARSVVKSFGSVMGIAPDSGHDNLNVNIEPGVIARNLHLTRRVEAQATSLVECLYYNDPQEFAALSKNDNTMTIAGRPYSYSNRLGQVVQSLRDAVTGFVQISN